MIVSPNRKIPVNDHCLEYNEKMINEVECLKLLGVHIDNKFSFSYHCENLICQRLKKFIPVFKKLRNYLSIKLLLKIYHSNVSSLIAYCVMALCHIV